MATKIKREKKVQKAQESKVIQQTIINRELLYLYPEDCTHTLARKAFRQKVKNRIRTLEKNIRKLEKKGLSKKAKHLITKVNSFRNEVLADPTMEV